MSILSGLIKEKRYKKTSSGYKLTSQYTDSSTVNMPDGNTATTNLGAIQGISSSLAANSPNIAASTQITNQLNQSLSGCYISFADAAGNPTDEPYIHWETEV